MARPVHFDISAADPERAAAFYREVFGWRLTGWGGPVEYWLIETGHAPEPGINGGMRRRQEGEPGGTVNTISVDSLDEAVEAVRRAGGTVERSRTAVPGVGWLAYCRDPEGNDFGLMEADESAA